ncbi:MAG: ABC transporter permease [Candidatus Aminicenantes bacterium]|nr:ABC transporter permease [Candidatus Aminicenantes bacterium]
MFKNYLKSAIRNVQRHRGYAFINITGLAIGMACCILITAYILRDISYDRFHEKADRIYRVVVDANVGGMTAKIAVSNTPLAPVLKKDYPEVLDVVRIDTLPRVLVKYQDRQFYEDKIVFADASIFDVFSFPIIKGDTDSALSAAHTVVLTEDTAKKYFGNEDPVGKILNFYDQYNFSVTGVVKNVPRNSHFSFDFLCSFESLYARDRNEMEVWLNFNKYTYVLLQNGFDYRILEQKLPALVDRYMGSDLKAIGGEIRYFLQPLRSIHLHSHLENEISGNSNILYIYIFSGIAFFIILIACINFMNLATARSAMRAREVGMRKVIGAARKDLVKQFLGESIFYSAVALIIALILVQIALPLFSALSGLELRMNYGELPWLIPGLLGLTLLVGVAAGSYPALFLSSFQPAAVLKNAHKTGTGNFRMRSILVISQFVISVTLIIGTLIIINQLKFMKNKDLGFDKNNLLTVRIMDRKIRQSLDYVKTELQKLPGVASVSVSSSVPGEGVDVMPIVPEGFTEDQALLAERINVDQDVMASWGMEIVKGRNFSKDFASDPQEAVIINETAAKRFGWDDPVGKTVQAAGDTPMQWEKKTVIGVVKDFHTDSLHKAIMPLYLTNIPDYLDTLSIKLDSADTAQVLETIKDKWNAIDPGRPLDYSFLDQTFGSKYKVEERLSDIFASFTLMAIFIACLGLFGVASFVSEQRTKEVGIRKVLGASIPGIVALLSKNFIKLVLIANLIAWPIAYFAMTRWLEKFAYRASMNPWIFFLSGIATLFIAIITVSYQSIKASISDPVKAIKYE